MSSCPYTSSMVLLAANNLYNMRHAEIQLDIELVDAALLWLNEALKEVQSEEIQGLWDTCIEAARTVKQKRAEDIVMSFGSGFLVNYLDNLGSF